MTWARQQTPGGEPLIALKPAHRHNYRLSAYARKANDFFPTPSDLATSLALGLSRLGLDLPRVALDPCGGDGAIRRWLVPFGVDVRLMRRPPNSWPGMNGSWMMAEPMPPSL